MPAPLIAAGAASKAAAAKGASVAAKTAATKAAASTAAKTAASKAVTAAPKVAAKATLAKPTGKGFLQGLQNFGDKMGESLKQIRGNSAYQQLFGAEGQPGMIQEMGGGLSGGSKVPTEMDYTPVPMAVPQTAPRLQPMAPNQMNAQLLNYIQQAQGGGLR